MRITSKHRANSQFVLQDQIMDKSGALRVKGVIVGFGETFASCKLATSHLRIRSLYCNLKNAKAKVFGAYETGQNVNNGENSPSCKSSEKVVRMQLQRNFWRNWSRKHADYNKVTWEFAGCTTKGEVRWRHTKRNIRSLHCRLTTVGGKVFAYETGRRVIVNDGGEGTLRCWTSQDNLATKVDDIVASKELTKISQNVKLGRNVRQKHAPI